MPHFLHGLGQAVTLARFTDWTRTPLGPYARWSQSLRMAASMLFRSSEPMLLWWGREACQLYNDACLDRLFAGKPCRPMGERAADCWREVWPKLAPLVTAAIERGVSSSWLETEALGAYLRFDGDPRDSRDESDVRYAISLSPLLDEHGAGQGVLVVCHDPTPAFALRAHERTGSRALAEMLPQMVWTAQPDGRLSYVNGRTATFLGTSTEELIGGGWRRFVHPEDLAESTRCWVEATALGTDFEAAFRLRRADGVYRYQLVRARPLFGKDQKLEQWFGTTTDIHEHECMRRELARRAETEQYLLGIVSHDLRNPLNVVTMGASMLAERADLDDKSKRAVARITKASQRCARMIADLLDFTEVRLGSGITLSPSVIDLGEVLEEVLDEQRATHPEHVLTLEVLGDVRGVWDRDRVAQAAGNLLSNALHYGDAERPVTVIVQRDGEQQVLIRVHNFGVPIPDERMPSMFQPLQRGTQQQDRSGRSIGLGLFIVKQIAEAHGGSVDVRSSEREGTTFTIALPRSARADA